MASQANTSNEQTGSIILFSSALIDAIYLNAGQREDDKDPTAAEETEIHSLTSTILNSNPTTRAEAVAVFERALEHLQCAADGVPTYDADVLYRAFKASQPLLCAA